MHLSKGSLAVIELDDTFYRNSQVRADALRSHLSETALEALAREVVRRLADLGTISLSPDDIEHPSDDDIGALCGALLSADPKLSRRIMKRLQAQKLTLDVLYGRYLAPAADRLGQMLDEGRIDFMQVNLGVSRLFELVNQLRNAVPYPKITKADEVLFASVPGEEHSLGVEMAAELFRQHGWDVKIAKGTDHASLMHEITQSPFRVLGLSSSGRRTAEALALMVHAVRAGFPEMYIIISGRIVKDEPDLVALMVADSIVGSVEEALSAMESMASGKR